MVWVDKLLLWLVYLEYHGPIITTCACPPKRSQNSLHRKLQPIPLAQRDGRGKKAANLVWQLRKRDNNVFSLGKKSTAKTVYGQSWTTSDPKRSWSVKIYKIENVTVKNTFAGTDQRTWSRVKLRYFDWPIPVFIRFIEISRIYRNIYEVK